MERPGSLPAATATLLALAAGATFVFPEPAFAQTRRFPLESAERLRLHNVTAEPATLHGKKGLRLARSAEAARRLDVMTLEEGEGFLGSGETESFRPVHLATGVAMVPAPQGNARSL